MKESLFRVLNKDLEPSLSQMEKDMLAVGKMTREMALGNMSMLTF